MLHRISSEVLRGMAPPELRSFVPRRLMCDAMIFIGTRTVSSRLLRKAIARLGEGSGLPVLALAHDFTKEAIELLRECDVRPLWLGSGFSTDKSAESSQKTEAWVATFVDRDAVRDAVASLGVGQPRVIERVSEYREKGEVWRIETSQGSYALRVYARGGEDARDVDVTVLKAVERAGLPAPRVVATGSARSRALLLTEWCSGRTVLAELLADPLNAHNLGRLFGTAQAAINKVEAPPILRQVQADAMPRAGRLLHLDFHPVNVLTDGSSITAIVDWENAESGDPRFDVARTVSLLRLAVAAHIPPRGRPVLRAFLRGYAQGYRESTDQVPGEMAPYYAWAGDYMLSGLARKADANLLRRIQRWIGACQGLSYRHEGTTRKANTWHRTTYDLDSTTSPRGGGAPSSPQHG